MDYERIYNEFIADRRTREAALIASGEYCEKHHIIPRSMGGTDEADNLIALTFGDHLIAHYYYAKAVDTRSAWEAASMMAGRGKGGRFVLTAKMVKMAEEARVKFAEAKRGVAVPAFKAWHDKKENKTVFKWEHKETGEKFNGTIRQLSEKTGIATNKACEIAYGNVKSRNGWKLAATVIKTRHDQLSKSARTPRTVFVNSEIGIEEFSSPMLMAEKYGGSSARYAHAERGNGSAYGWVKRGAKITSGKHRNCAHARAKKVVCLSLNKTFESVADAGAKTGVDRRLISAAVTGKQKTAGGYRWAYAA